MTILDPFGEEAKTIAFPHKSFDLVGTLATEQEQRSRDKEWQMIPCFDDGGKGIDSIAHIGSAPDNIDCCERVQVSSPKHGAPRLGSGRYGHRKHLRLR